MPPDKKHDSKPLKAPRGTRDLYPEDTARIRYIQKAWTDASVRHGFEEIEGPTFETTDLYAVKSGEGILGELFQAFSGKSPEEIEEVRQTGRAPFALRPEFTPTLARMYAARAKQLNKPCKWFTAGPYFRAERPQRGRLREFLQWNCDVIGNDATPEGRAQADADIIGVAVGLLDSLGVTTADVRIGVNHREMLGAQLAQRQIMNERATDFLSLVDRQSKMSRADFLVAAAAKGFDESLITDIERAVGIDRGAVELDTQDNRGRANDIVRQVFVEHHRELIDSVAQRAWSAAREDFTGLLSQLNEARIAPWARLDPSIVRGLAYYTGTVFEASADGERAVAGGGRYDSLIELLGGPPTPAVGVAMGDVVLGLLLEDKGLMPQGAELLDAVSAPGASRRPEVFVISADDEATDAMSRRLVADLRRGIVSRRALDDGAMPWDGRRYEIASGGIRPLHARQTSKSTRNLKKLLADAERQLAKFAAIVHGADRVQLRDLDRRTELTPQDVPGLPDQIRRGVAEFSVNPMSPVYVGRAARALLG